MSTEQSYIDYICEQIEEVGEISYKKMFGEYMIYCNAKPIIIVCNNIAFAKNLPKVEELFDRYEMSKELDSPYKGAKPHFVIDVDNQDFFVEVARRLYEILPAPKPKKKKG